MEQIVAMLALSDIQENEAALRNVDREGEDFQGLVASVKTNGIINAINVTPLLDKETGEVVEGKYKLIDGLQRFSAASDAGLETIPCVIGDVTEDEGYVIQLLANAHRVPTKPAEYSGQLNRILMGNPTMTKGDLAGKLSMSESWLDGMLKLNKLADALKGLVDEGKIVLTNAQALSKLPEAEQMKWLEEAQSNPPQEFVPKINERARDIRKAAKEGRSAEEAVFSPVPRLRKLKDILAMREDSAGIKKAMAAAGAKDPITFTIDFLTSLDPASVKVQEAKDVERKAAREAGKKKREVERADKKEKDAKDNAEVVRKKYEEDQAKDAKAAKTPKKA